MIKSIKIEGMHCPNCVAAVKRELEALEGVTKVDVSLEEAQAIVEVENVDTKVKKTYHIVGSYETDPVAGKISDQSAIGGAIMGTSIGEKVNVELPNGKTLHLLICDVRRENA